MASNVEDVLSQIKECVYTREGDFVIIIPI